MSTPFYDLASLVVVPSGYKASKVYAQKPLTTDGQLTFSRASTATRVNASGLIETVSSNVPRLDYLNSSCPRLLLEPQRQNVCQWSEQIDNAGWGKTNAPTITTNIATAPDGYGGADGIQDTTGGTFKRIRQSLSVTANQTHTASVFVKKETSETNYGGLALVFSNRWAYGIIDAVNGTIVVSSDSIIASSSTKVEDYGDWWRFSLTVTDNQSNTTLEVAYYATISTNGTSTGVGAGSVRTVWGFQLELGASYSSSYIPTLGAAVTRGADACSKQNIAGTLPTAYPFTLYAEGFLRENNEVLLSINDYTQSDVYYQIGATTSGFFGAARNGAQSSVITSSGRSVGTHKVAAVFTSSEIRLFANGALIATAANAQTFNTNANDVLLGQLRVNSDLGLRSSVNQAIVFKSALSDADCIALTA